MKDFMSEYILSFPSAWQFEAGDVIDNAVKTFSRDHQSGLRLIKGTVISCVGGIRWMLETVPWAVLILAVWALAWRQTKKWYVGALYAAMMVFVGSC